MNILILQGGARKKGNTAHVISLVENLLKSQNHSVETIYLHGKQLNGCMGCGVCKTKPGELGCVQKDDVLPILEKMTGVDAIIFSSPLYFWGVNAQLKAVIDRMFCMYTDAKTPAHQSLLDGKKQALLMTGGGGFEDNADGTFTGFKRTVPYLKTVHAADLFIGKCSVPEKMDSSVDAKVADFVQALTD